MIIYKNEKVPITTMSEVNDNYEKLRLILSPSMGVHLEKGELTDKLIRNVYTEHEAFVVSNGIKKGLRPVSFRKIRKRTKIPKEELKETLKAMDYKGNITKVGPYYILLPYLPGLFELYFTHNRDDPARMKAAGEAHYELLRRGFHVEHSQSGLPLYRVIPAIEPTKKAIEINKSMDVKHQILPYEVLEKYLSKKKKFAVQKCSCRNAAELAGEPCECTKENFCVSTGFLANRVIESGVGREVSFEELMQIMKRAEQEGLVHEVINIQKTAISICNCCSCCCGFLKSVKELDNKKAVVISNFDPITNYDQCESCKTCVNICPMSAIDYVEDKPVTRLEDCLGCGLCASNCPQNAITLKKVRNTIPIKNSLKLLRLSAKKRKQKLTE